MLFTLMLTFSSAAWGGVVSSATYATGDSGADFGNTYYNDHHFHYGYHVLTAAVIGHLDAAWLSANREWVNALVRDYANPSSADAYFPVNRMFDWYHGHSFAHGLFESADGRDQESSSEDVMAAYAMKMWGTVSGDADMAARGNLQLAVLARALNLYYLYTSNNTVQPADFIANKAAGILFENKIDHTTYFGTNIEYIQGIHMLPLLPATTYIRGMQFVTEEWNQYFSNGRVDSVAGGWRGVLYGNLATIDPTSAFAWFNQANFDMSLLDGGASLTWYIAFAAGKCPPSFPKTRYHEKEVLAANLSNLYSTWWSLGKTQSRPSKHSAIPRCSSFRVFSLSFSSNTSSAAMHFRSQSLSTSCIFVCSVISLVHCHSAGASNHRIEGTSAMRLP